MSQALRELNKISAALDDSLLADDAELRLDLAEVIWRGMCRNGWSQRKLSAKSGVADAVISNLIHGNRNWTCRMAVRVARALGVKLHLQEALVDPETVVWRLHDSSGVRCIIDREGHSSGTEEIKIGEA